MICLFADDKNEQTGDAVTDKFVIFRGGFCYLWQSQVSCFPLNSELSELSPGCNFMFNLQT